MRPKTDREIQAAVADELAHTPDLDADQIEVTVRAGIVTLSGSAHSEKDRSLAEGTAVRVADVRAVADELVVRAAGVAGDSDADIAVLAAQLLDSAPDVPAGSVRVVVHNRVLTLSGNVSSEHEREAAAQAVEHVRDVVAVTNDIHVVERR